VRRISKQEAADWRHNETTAEVLERIRSSVSEASEILVRVAGNESSADARMSGYIQGLQSVLDLAQGDEEDEMEAGGIHNPN
jgi:hypothetical protein